MKNCEYFERLISDRLDGPVSSEKEAELQKHLEECSDCSSFFETATRQTGLLRSLPEIESKLSLASFLRDKMLKRAEKKNLWRRGVYLPYPAAAALLLLLLTGWLLVLNSSRDFQKREASGSGEMQYVVTMKLKAAKAVLVDSLTDTAMHRKESF